MNMEQKNHSGRFITFEGIDGAGKSTHIQFVTDLLRADNRQVVVTREPGRNRSRGKTEGDAASR